MSDQDPTGGELTAGEPEEALYRSLYSPVDLRSMLETADSRGQIRRLPVPHLFYGLQSLDEEEIQRLLPHLTEEQWTGVLDLELWSRDEMDTTAFLNLERHVLPAEDAVARKLIRAADPEHWELLFRSEMTVHARTQEDEFEQEVAEGEWMETPDGNFLIQLPFHLERSRLLREILERLYSLDPEFAARLLASSRARTSVELQEMAYQNRRQRVESMGFQDYFEAVEVYAPLSPDDPLPQKGPVPLREISTLPAPADQGGGDLLLFRILARAEIQQAQSLLEEIFFVCNKVLSADQASPARPEPVKRTIRKAISGMNLGLELWSEASPLRAADGTARHYLQSFFQLGYGHLLELQRDARRLRDSPARPEPGSFQEAFLEGLARNYPLLSELREGKIRTRFLQTRGDLQRAREEILRMGGELAAGARATDN